MKSTYIKLPAIFAMIVGLLVVASFFLMILLSNKGIVGQGVGLAWIAFDMILIWFTLYLYAVDAILSIVKIFKKIHPIFNLVLSLTIICEVILTIVSFIETNFALELPGNLLFSLLGMLYLIIFVLEIISIIKHVKMNSKKNVNYIVQ